MDNNEQLDTDIKSAPQHPNWMVGVLSFALGFGLAIAMCSFEGKIDISIKSQTVYPTHHAE